MARTFGRMPGVVIANSPASSGVYLGSPAIIRLADGALLASHDEFGPGSSEHTAGVTRVYRSEDDGSTWEAIGSAPAFWASLWSRDGREMYLFGTSHNEGDAVALRSCDGGRTWDSAAIRSDDRYHGAPVPVVEVDGYLNTAWETCAGYDFAMKFRARIFRAQVDSDLLEPTSWTESNAVAGNPEWLGGCFNGWLEGNVIALPDATIGLLKRVDMLRGREFAALLRLGADGQLSFNPQKDFIRMPGASKKFTVRFDPVSRRYWALTSPAGPADDGIPAYRRNRLCLLCSRDLGHWRVVKNLLYHPDVAGHGFQYADWIFDGENILAVVRTAFGDAANYHDSNFITFHRIERFRRYARRAAIILD